MIDWARMLETLIAAGAGAGVIVVIDWGVRYSLYKRRNFQEAIRIQVALNQMLSISLQIRRFYNEKRSNFTRLYVELNLIAPENVWLRFRHVDLAAWKNTFEVIGFDWDITQFLTRKENTIRHVLAHLIPIKLGFESLMYIIEERNSILLELHPLIIAAIDGKPQTFIYENNNLVKIIGLINNIKLREMTDHYVRTLDAVIVDCDKAFNAMVAYIDNNFCCYEALKLATPLELQAVLEEVKANEGQKEKQK